MVRGWSQCIHGAVLQTVEMCVPGRGEWQGGPGRGRGMERWSLSLQGGREASLATPPGSHMTGYLGIPQCPST